MASRRAEAVPRDLPKPVPEDPSPPRLAPRPSPSSPGRRRRRRCRPAPASSPEQPSALLIECDGVAIDAAVDAHRVAFNRSFAELGMDW